MNKPEDRFEVTATASTHFAWLRTRLAFERTLMAWARTAVSLIGFGFTMVKFFDWVQSAAVDTRPVLMPAAPRAIGLALIGAGVLSLALSVWQYQRGLKYLWSREFDSVAGVIPENPMTTPLAAVSVILIVVGIFAFITVIFRLA